MSRHTLSELYAVSRLAARAVGYSWGHAEEAGMAVRILESHGLAGLQAMHILLQRQDGTSDRVNNHFPEIHGEVWQPTQTWVCGLVAGMSCTDRPILLKSNQPLQITGILSPLLFAAALHVLAKKMSQTYCIAWHDVQLTCSPHHILAQGNNITPQEPCTVKVQIPTEQIANPKKDCGLMQAVDDALYRAMQDLAWRTYVPNSEQSRLGAGE